MSFYPFAPATAGVSFAPWLPADNGLITATQDPELASSSTGLTAGTVYVRLMQRWPGGPLSNLWVGVSAAGVGASAGTFAGVYSAAGVLLEQTADLGTALNSVGPAELPLTAPVTTLAEGADWWAAIVVNLATTQPSLFRNTTGGTLSNVNLATAASRNAIAGTVLAALPANFNPAALTTPGDTWWFGAS